MRSYMNRCVKCEAGRAGTCPWTSRFPAPEADSVSSPEPSKETHEDRALTLHEKAGAPCKDQITLDDFIDQVDEFIHGAILPASTDELLETLTYFEHSLSRLRRLTRNFKPVFNDSILAAVEHVLAHIDFAFLKKKLDIEVLIHGIHPDYNRDLMLDRRGFPQTLVKQYRKRARPYKDPDAPAETQAADPIAISAAELPPELTEPDWRWQRPPQLQSTPKQRQIAPAPPKPASYLPDDIVRRTLRLNPRSFLLQFLQTLFDEQTIVRLVNEYRIGVTKDLSAIFYQIDESGHCRAGKIIRYNPKTGHRIKDASVPVD